MDQELTGHAMPPIRGSSNFSIFSIFLFDFCLSLSLCSFYYYIFSEEEGNIFETRK